MRPPLKLAFIVEHFDITGEGLENDAVQLCRALADRGHDIHVIARDGHAPAPITLHLGLDEVEHHLAAIAPELTIDWAFLHPADIHRIGGGVHAAFLGYNLRAFPGPAGWLKRLGYRKRKHRSILAREHLILTRPHARFLAISNFVAGHAIAHGAPRDAVHVLHNPVDVERFSPARVAPLRAAARRQWGIPEDARVLLFVAHNLRLKNLALLRRICTRLMPDYPRLRLLVIAKRPPTWNATWLVTPGLLTQIERAYAAADILVHPTYFDSFANVVLEAMCSAMPVLVSQDAGVSELITDGENGLVLPVHGPNAEGRWFEAIQALLDAPGECRRLGLAAHAEARHHDYPAYLDAVEAYLYETLAARP